MANDTYEMGAYEMGAYEMDTDETNDIDSAWSNFCDDDHEVPVINSVDDITSKEFVPKCSPLNISTKTKISYLNYPIDLKKVFWAIPLIKYHDPQVGVIKKQMKFNSLSP
jgi:hypothetical protein